MVSNLDWTEGLSALAFLRDIGKHFPVNQMLSRETVRARLESGGISYTEFSYQILQANDFLELYRRHGCTLQIGGSDQWGNLVSGVDLIRRVTGESVHALATPLITKPDGTKYGKTEGGAIWLSPELMSPYAFHQFWLNRADAEVPGLLRVFTFRSREEIEDLEREIAERPAARTAQRVLADDLTTLVHGADETARATAAGRALFGQGDLRELDEDTLAAALAEAPHATVDRVGATVRRPDGGVRHRGEQVRCPACHRGGRRVPEQRQGGGHQRGAAGQRPAARPVPGAAARQADGRRGRSQPAVAAARADRRSAAAGPAVSCVPGSRVPGSCLPGWTACLPPRLPGAGLPGAAASGWTAVSDRPQTAHLHSERMSIGSPPVAPASDLTWSLRLP